MRQLFYYLKPYIAKMSAGLTVKFIGTVMDLFIPWILAYLIDEIVPLNNISHIMLWGLMMVACSIVAVITNIIANRTASKVAADVTENIRRDLFKKISYLSCRQIDMFTVPSLVSRLTSDTYNVNRMLGMVQRLGVRAPIMLLGGIMVTLVLDPALAGILIGVLPFIAAAVWIISKKSIPLYGKSQKVLDKMVRTVRENIAGIRVIKALSRTEHEKERFSKVNEEAAGSESKAGMVMAVTNPLMNLLLNLGLTLVVAAGAWRVNMGLTQPGKIIAFLTYFTIILNAMMSITRIFVLISKGAASFGRIEEVMETPKDLLLREKDCIKSEYHVSFENVSFSYLKNKNNLSDISFGLKQGETLGIIGAAGSGKSSIIKLLLRFYEADEGRIRIFGRNIDSIPDEELHRKFGIVFQNDILFADTIAENINFGRGLSADQIAMSSIFAQAEEFIDSLSDRYEHGLAVKGTNLSGGQKQRILISRALAGNPEILILDDSSSALDYKTDARLRRSLWKNFKYITKIIVAQRISSIKHANCILVLDEGKMIGCGTHEELLKVCSSYKEIYQWQMGGAGR